MTTATTITLTDTVTDEILDTITVADYATPADVTTKVMARTSELVGETGHQIHIGRN